MQAKYNSVKDRMSFILPSKSIAIQKTCSTISRQQTSALKTSDELFP
jgi:hypothetical protein